MDYLHIILVLITGILLAIAIIQGQTLSLLRNEFSSGTLEYSSSAMLQRLDSLEREIGRMSEGMREDLDWTNKTSFSAQLIKRLDQLNEKQVSDIDWTDNTSFGYQVLDRLEEIEKHLLWTNKTSFANQVIDRLDQIIDQID